MANKSTTAAEDSIKLRFISGLQFPLKGYVLPNLPMHDITTNETIEDSDSLPWARLTVNWFESVPSGNGGGTWMRRPGLITVDVFTKKGGGMKDSQSVIEHYTELFENTEFDDVKTFQSGTVKINDDPTWFINQVNINFYCEGF